MVNELIIPALQFLEDPLNLADGSLKKRENPVKFMVGPVTKGDGTILEILEVEKAAFYLTQQPNSGAEKVWSLKDKVWDTPSAVNKDEMEWMPMEYVEQNPEKSWKGSALFMGEKIKFPENDGAGNYYSYRIKCYFECKSPDDSISSGETVSMPIKLPAMGGDIKAGLEAVDMNFSNPQWIRFYIKDSAGAVKAEVKLESSGSIIISNNTADITLFNNGDIGLSPMSGGCVRVNGDLQVTGAII